MFVKRFFSNYQCAQTMRMPTTGVHPKRGGASLTVDLRTVSAMAAAPIAMVTTVANAKNALNGMGASAKGPLLCFCTPARSLNGSISISEHMPESASLQVPSPHMQSRSGEHETLLPCFHIEQWCGHTWQVLTFFVQLIIGCSTQTPSELAQNPSLQAQIRSSVQ